MKNARIIAVLAMLVFSLSGCARVTRRLGDEIAHVYGFPIPRRLAPVQER